MPRMSWCTVVAAVGLWAIAWVAPAAAVVRVVATIFPLADMVRQVGREQVEVVTLLPPGANPHTFEPTPIQIRAVADADVCVRVGGVDAWTAKLVAARGSGLTVVTLTDGLKLLAATEPGAAPELDPHVWLDPVLMRDHGVRLIAEGLERVAPELRAGFETGANEFRAALTRLDSDIRTILAPISNRNYVAYHSAWR